MPEFKRALLFFVVFLGCAGSVLGQVVTEISKLPSIQRLEQTPGWSRLDSEVAVQQVVAHLKKQEEYAPLDCTFELSDPIQVKYGPGEVRSDVENRLRRQMPTEMVLTTQFDEWTQLPKSVPGFKPTDPSNPEWISFLSLTLPDLLSQADSRYPSSGISKVEVNGLLSACADIKRYLHQLMKVLPENVSCVEPRSFEVRYVRELSSPGSGSGGGVSTVGSKAYTTLSVSRRGSVEWYKLGYPHAEGFQYRKLKLIDCSFEKQTTESEKPLAETGPKQPEPLPATRNQTRPPNQKASDLKTETLTPAQEKQKFREWQEQQKKEEKAWLEKKKQEEIQAQKEIEDRALKFVSPSDLLTAVAVAGTDMGRVLVREYQKSHDTPYRDQTQLTADEKRLEQLKSKYEKQEKERHTALQTKYPDEVGEFESFTLDPEAPFDSVSVVVDVPLYPEELIYLQEYFEKNNPGWMVGCRVRSLVKKDRAGNVLTDFTTIECLVPRFSLKYRARGEDKAGVSIPVPVLGEYCKLEKNNCGVVKGVKNRKGIRLSRLEAFGRKGKWESRIIPSTQAYQERQLTRSVTITGGLRGKVVSAFDQKPIQNATVLIHGKQDYAAQTPAHGGYEFNPIGMKGLEPKVSAAHRYYHPNSKPFGRLKIFDVTDIGTLELEPKRVTLRGKISETFQPRYGSGLEGIVVQIKGYPQFHALTRADGTYEIKNVPATLTELTVADPSQGHQAGQLSFVLDPDRDNEGLNVQLVPNLTTVSGRVHISSGRGAPKMKVQIPGHPELFAITDEDGRYEIKDVPHDIPGLLVYPDPLGDHDGKSEPMDGLNRYVANKKDIEVKYNRCDVSGQVVDLVTLQGIPHAKVWVEGAEGRHSVTADENGNYELRKIPLNARRLKASTTNKKYFASKPIEINPRPAEGLIITDQQIRMMPKDYTTDRIVIVLTWNKKQPDLDSQLYVPGKIRLYFANHNDATLSDKIGGYLDVDDTGYGGRETTIIELEKGKAKVPGLYRFMVYQFRDVGLSFAEAGAEIDVYKDGAHWAHLTPPPGRGLLWYALSVDDQNVSQKNLIRDYPEFKEYTALSKEYEGYDRKMQESEARVTLAQQRHERAVQDLAQAQQAVDQITQVHASQNAQLPATETPAEKKTRLDRQAQELAPHKKRLGEAQRFHDSALAEKTKRTEEDRAFKDKVGKRKDEIQLRLEKLGIRLNEILNNPT